MEEHRERVHQFSRILAPPLSPVDPDLAKDLHLPPPPSALLDDDGNVINLPPPPDSIDDDPEDGTSLKSSRTKQEKRRVGEERGVEMYSFRHLCFRGIPDSPPSLRTTSWKLLLNLLSPVERGHWKEETEKRRREYYQIVQDICEQVASFKPVGRGGIPYALKGNADQDDGNEDGREGSEATMANQEEHYAGLLPQDILLDQIDKDCKRTQVSLAFFSQPIPPHPDCPLSPPSMDEAKTPTVAETRKAGSASTSGSSWTGAKPILSRRALFDRLDMLNPEGVEGLRERPFSPSSSGSFLPVQGASAGSGKKSKTQDRFSTTTDSSTTSTLLNHHESDRSSDESTSTSPSIHSDTSQTIAETITRLSMPSLSLQPPSGPSTPVTSAAPRLADGFGSDATDRSPPPPLPPKSPPQARWTFSHPHNDPTSTPDLRWESLERILYCYASLNSVRYVQGMNELACPLLYVFAHDERKEESCHAEADAFWAFSSLMGEVRDLFDRGLDGDVEGSGVGSPRGQEGGRSFGDGAARVMSGVADSGSGIGWTLTRFAQQLHWLDPKLADDLDRKGVRPSYYAFRWLTCLCSREFAMPDLIRIWDSFLALLPASTEKGSRIDQNMGLSPAMEFLIDLCCAMVISLKERLLNGNFGSNLGDLQRFECEDVDDLLRLAFSIREKRITSLLTGDGDQGYGTMGEAGLALARRIARGPTAKAFKERIWRSGGQQDVDDTASVISVQSAATAPPTFGSSTGSTTPSSTGSMFKKYADVFVNSDTAASLSKVSTNGWIAASMWRSQAPQTLEKLQKDMTAGVEGIRKAGWTGLGESAAKLIRPPSPPDIPFLPPTPDQGRRSPRPVSLDFDKSYSTPMRKSTSNTSSGGPKPLLLSSAVRRSGNASESPSSSRRSSMNLSPHDGVYSSYFPEHPGPSRNRPVSPLPSASSIHYVSPVSYDSRGRASSVSFSRGRAETAFSFPSGQTQPRLERRAGTLAVVEHDADPGFTPPVSSDVSPTRSRPRHASEGGAGGYSSYSRPAENGRGWTLSDPPVLAAPRAIAPVQLGPTYEEEGGLVEEPEVISDYEDPSDTIHGFSQVQPEHPQPTTPGGTERRVNSGFVVSSVRKVDHSTPDIAPTSGSSLTASRPPRGSSLHPSSQAPVQGEDSAAQISTTSAKSEAPASEASRVKPRRKFTSGRPLKIPSHSRRSSTEHDGPPLSASLLDSETFDRRASYHSGDASQIVPTLTSAGNKRRSYTESAMPSSLSHGEGDIPEGQKGEPPSPGWDDLIDQY